MTSVGISALGHTPIQFVEPGVQVNDDYYHIVLLREGLLPECENKNASAWFFNFFGTR